MHTIGKVATLAGVSTDTLRYYEKEHLIEPASKTEAGYRLYNDEAVRRIRFIKTAQHCGFTLSDIHELLTLKQSDSACCEDVRSVAIEKRLRIAHKLRALQAMSAARLVRQSMQTVTAAASAATVSVPAGSGACGYRRQPPS